jgi:hypothetical protein
MNDSLVRQLIAWMLFRTCEMVYGLAILLPSAEITEKKESFFLHFYVVGAKLLGSIAPTS